MLKALFKLCLLGSIPLVYLVLSGDYSPISLINAKLNEHIMSDAYMGTFERLDRILDEPDPQQRMDTFNELKKHFGMEMRLRELHDVADSNRKLKRLRKGEVVFIESDGDTVAYKLKNYDWVITTSSEETENQEIFRMARGMLYFIGQQLAEPTENDLNVKLDKLSTVYGFKFDHVNRDQFHRQNPDLDLNTSDEVDWTWYEDDVGADIFLIPYDDNRYVAVTVDMNQTFVQFLIAGIVVISIVALGLGILAWLWPAWKDHKVLTKKVLAFGQGQLDSRVQLRKGSFAEDIGESFNTMADNIQQLIGANQQLTNAVAHDLRTPLARLRFANEILDSGECTDEEGQRYRQTINSSIEALDYLINQTLLHSRYTLST